MTANSVQLQERQIVNIADGKCLGNIKDIELNLWTGAIQGLVLPGVNTFWSRLQNTGELLIPWTKVVRIGVDVILVDMPELVEADGLFGRSKRKKAKDESERWQQEVAEYQEEVERSNIIVLHPDEYREV